MSMSRAALTTLATLATLLLNVVGSEAGAAEMTQAEFLAAVGGDYSPVLPSPQLLVDQFHTPSGIRIFERQGELYVENNLFLNSKCFRAEYRVTRIECFSHAPESTSCNFDLEIVDEGAFVHFLGVTPRVTVDRRTTPYALIISPGYSVAGAFRVEPIIVQKKP